MASWHLVITNISATGLKADNVHLVASLSGDESNNKQSAPLHKKGSTFEFTVEGAALLDTRLEFKIKKKDSLGCKTDVVGEVDVPVKDLLVNGCAGDMNLEVLSREVTSSYPKTVAVLRFSYKLGERLPRQDTRRKKLRRFGKKLLQVGMGTVLNVIVITATGGAVTNL